MNMRKIFYLAILSFSLVFASCSMNKDVFNTSSLQSGRLQSQQQLAIQSESRGKMEAINTQVSQNVINTVPIDISNTSAKVQIPSLYKHKKAFKSSNFVASA